MESASKYPYAGFASFNKYCVDIKSCSFVLQWFLDRMADDDWWPMQILIKCPNQIVRQVRKDIFKKRSGSQLIQNWPINGIENNLQSPVSCHRSHLLLFSSALLTLSLWSDRNFVLYIRPAITASFSHPYRVCQNYCSDLQNYMNRIN